MSSSVKRNQIRPHIQPRSPKRRERINLSVKQQRVGEDISPCSYGKRMENSIYKKKKNKNLHLLSADLPSRKRRSLAPLRGGVKHLREGGEITTCAKFRKNEGSGNEKTASTCSITVDEYETLFGGAESN